MYRLVPEIRFQRHPGSGNVLGKLRVRRVVRCKPYPGILVAHQHRTGRRQKIECAIRAVAADDKKRSRIKLYASVHVQVVAAHAFIHLTTMCRQLTMNVQFLQSSTDTDILVVPRTNCERWQFLTLAILKY